MKFVGDTVYAILRAVERVVSFAFFFLIRAYQAVHVAFFRGSCRFHPTCSHYALEAIALHGPARGSLLAMWRVLRCQPFCRGGFDPVPEPKSKLSDVTCTPKHFRPQNFNVLAVEKNETH